MIVPNYVPDQLEVPGNVAEQPYPARIASIRRVVGLYVTSIVLVAGLSKIAVITVPLGTAVGVLAVALLVLEVWRIISRGRTIEATISSFSLLILLPIVGMTIGAIRSVGMPVWQLLAAPLCVGAYTLGCGRDFSFMGCYFLSLVASTISIAAIGMMTGLAPSAAWFAVGTNFLFLTFVVYDLASLLSRRSLMKHSKITSWDR